MSVAEAPTNFPFTATAFLVGSTTSIVAGYIGMLIAVYSNVRVTFMCTQDTHKGFITAFRGGQVLGFMLVGLALLILSVIIIIFKSAWYDAELEKILANGDLSNVRASGATSSA
jgi:Na+/H+-translocating membrane pyrophosphatase